MKRPEKLFESTIVCEVGGYVVGVVGTFCDDGYVSNKQNGNAIARWWWAYDAQKVCVGSVQMHTGQWEYHEDATAKYLSYLGNLVVA